MVGNTILISKDVSVTVLSVRHRSTVRLGFEAPKEIPIWREEIYNKIQEELKEGQQHE
ncbi:MAG: carbon storage regulator [Oceanospirillaceae bacterium]|nr:carbon storage regulator [Oceanospirillaceae bacterium]